jgi:hypothetical protein
LAFVIEPFAFVADDDATVRSPVSGAARSLNDG